MAHVRKALRDWAKTALAGSPHAGSRVEIRRTLPLPDALQPTLLVSIENERCNDRSMDGTQLRLLDMRVTACAKGDSAATEDTLDALAVFVEEAFAADPTLGGRASTYEYQSTEFAFAGSGDKTLCTAALTFAVALLTRRGDPETLL